MMVAADIVIANRKRALTSMLVTLIVAQSNRPNGWIRLGLLLE